MTHRSASLFAALCLLGAAAHADVVVMRADRWYPVNLEPGSDNPGYVIEIAEKALALAGHQLDYALYPWERSVDGVRRGKIDCLPGVHRNTVPDFVFTQESVGVDRMAFYARRDAPPFDYQGLGDLQDKVVAVIGGYGYTEEIDAYINTANGAPNLQVTRGDKPLQRNIRMLLARRVDLVLESIPAFEFIATEMGVIDQLHQISPLPGSPTLHIACSPKKLSSRDYVNALDDGIRTLRQSGELQKILEKYGVADWEANDTREVD